MTAASHEALAPYLPRLVIDWLATAPELRARTIEGTGVFADISGFTNLTEKLSRRGRVGAEEMGDTLNAIFDELLSAAYGYGAALLKWGGDAVLLLFDGPDHALRAAAASLAMQRVIQTAGVVRAGGGTVRLKMSIGLHSGDLDFLLVGEEFRDLIVTGPGASQIAHMETAAAAGQVVASPAAAAAITAAGGSVGAAVGPGFLVTSAPVSAMESPPAAAVVPASVELADALPASLRDHLLGGNVAHEHRAIAVCFVEFSGIDMLRATAGLDAVADAVGAVVEACQRAAADFAVTYLSSDIYPDGGKVILVAGAPRNTGDDAARVLSAARAVLDADLPLAVRAGVNVGTVFAGDYGPPYRRVYSITGDCVNLAARLMAKAGHGELVASRDALDASRVVFAETPLEPFSVKGKSVLIHAALVGGPDPRSRQDPDEHRLIGRDDDLELLRTLWREASAGQGRAAEISGAPGVGKSRLIGALAAEVDQVTWIDGSIYGSHTPYEVFHRLFAHESGIDPLAPDAGERLRSLVQVTAPELTPMAPLIALPAGIAYPLAPELDGLDADVRKSRTEAATSAVLAALWDTPRLIVFNDVDYIDAASTDLIDRLIRDAGDRPWLIVVTRRPTAIWRPPHDVGAASVVLAPLSADDADQLLEQTLGERRLPPHRAQTLVEQSGGNPLFLIALGAAVRAGDDIDQLPATLEGVVGAQIDRLDPRARRMLRAASVVGTDIDRDLLAGLAVHAGLTSANWSALEEFLVDDGRTLRFRHHLVRDTAYAGLPFRTRRQLHAQLVELLGERPNTPDRTGLLALHSFEAGEYESALDLSRAAAAHARAHFANTEAVANCRRALAAARQVAGLDASAVGDVWLAAAQAYIDLDDLEPANSAAMQAWRLLKADPCQRAEAALAVAIHRRLNGKYTEALRWTSMGLAVLDAETTPAGCRARSQLLLRRAHVLITQGRLREVGRWTDQAITAAEAGADDLARAEAIELAALAQSQLGRAVDLEAVAATVPLQRSRGNLVRVARTQNILGVMAFNQGEWRISREAYRDAGATYAQLGRLHDVALQQTNEAEVMVFQGDLQGAEELIGAAMRAMRGARDTAEYAFAVTQQARVAMARGEHLRAIDLFTVAREIQHTLGERYDVVLIDAMLAEAVLLAGHPDAALRRLDDAIERNRQIGAPIDYVQRIRALALIASHEIREGRALLRRALAAARRTDALYDEWQCLLALQRVGAATVVDRAALAALRPALKHRLGVIV